MPGPVEKCYPSGQNRILTIAGMAAMAAGILLLFVCVPRCIWLALLGAGLIAAGCFLLKLSDAWR